MNFLKDVRTLQLRVLELEAEHRELDHLIHQLQQEGSRMNSRSVG